jgi:hypothetical protein
MRYASFLFLALVLTTSVVCADDGLGLKRGGNRSNVTVSGVSSGAAMALQYAVGHSKSIAGVGSIAGPPWGCADGSASQAINKCMCGRQAPDNKIDLAHELAATDKIDSLSASSTPFRLSRSYVFQSPADAVVVEKSGQANIAFLSSFIGNSPEVDWGDEADGSNRAGHGIIAPDSHNESCQASGTETTYIRYCGAEDNAGKMFHALYDERDSPFDPTERVNDIPETEVWQFDQQHLIDLVKVKPNTTVAPDTVWGWLWFWRFPSERRKNFDMAEKGYIYVPPSCRQAGSSCRVHIALHGCRQNAKDFANKAGYNNWAEHYKVIVVYPAIEPSASLIGEGCQAPPLDSTIDELPIKLNPNGCWDWWGYLDTSKQRDRYLTKDSPQMRVIERIIFEVTGP